jgi:hypothetical protein
LSQQIHQALRQGAPADFRCTGRGGFGVHCATHFAVRFATHPASERVNPIDGRRAGFGEGRILGIVGWHRR